MASNFRMFLYQNSDSLHVKISGDFDGSSAHELIHAIKNHNGNARNIYVHTGSLSVVHSFGLDVFKKNLKADNSSLSLTFTGEHGTKLALEGSRIL